METTIQDQTSKLFPSISSSYDIAEVFTKLQTGSGGGCKKDRAAQQIVTKMIEIRILHGARRQFFESSLQQSLPQKTAKDSYKNDEIAVDTRF